MPSKIDDDASFEHELDLLLERWDSVQKRLKEAELISLEAVIPAVNEMRYVGRVLVTALRKESINSDERRKALNIADQYLVNADHDISDALIFFFQNKADTLNSRFGAGAIIQKLPSYQEFLEDLEKARKIVIESRGNIPNRDHLYEELQTVVEKLIKCFFVLDKAETFFAIEVNAYNKRIKDKQKTIYILFALIAGASIFQLFGWI